MSLPEKAQTKDTIEKTFKAADREFPVKATQTIF